MIAQRSYRLGLSLPVAPLLAYLAIGASAGHAQPIKQEPIPLQTYVVQTQANGDSPVSASQLKDAIADIKRRLAEQQEGRQNTSTGELTAELKAARETIAELTRGMNRLRAERDNILAEMQSMGNDLSERSDQIAALERQLEATTEQSSAERESLQAALEERIAERDTARSDLATATDRLNDALGDIDQLTATLEQAWADRAAVEQSMQEAQDTAAADLAERERVIAAAESEIDRLTSELESGTADLQSANASITELQIQLTAMTSAAQSTSSEAERSAERVAALEEDLRSERDDRESVEAALSEQRERVRQVSLEAEGRLKERTATLTSSIQSAEQRIAELETEITGLREVATTSVGEVQVLGEQLLATLRENEELVVALAEVRASKEIIEGELDAARKDVDLYASQAALGARNGNSGEALSRLQRDLADAQGEIASLSEQLIKQEQLSAGEGDPATLGQRLLELEEALAESQAQNISLTAELEALKGAATIEAAPSEPLQPRANFQLAAIGDDDIDRLLSDLNAVDTGDGWIMTIPEGIVFAPGSDQLADAANEPLTRVAAMLRYFDASPVRIIGHTDSYGDPDVNRALSVARAESVRDYLSGNFGIEVARLETAGFGEDQPIASNDTVSGRRANRRVEVFVQTPLP